MNQAAVTARKGCAHCGEPLPDSPAGTDHSPDRYCCSGCAAAADWIHGEHLDDYYRLRSAAAGRVGEESTDLSAWDRNEVVAPFVHETTEGREIVFATDGMRCAACAWLIDRALSREPGVKQVSANAVTGRIRLVWDPARNRLSAILGRMQALGYRPWLAGSIDSEQARRTEWRHWLLRLGLAGIGAVQAMMFSEALYLDTAAQMPLPTRDAFRWLTFLLATPVVFYAGFPFLAGAWRELSGRRAGMDTLVAVSTLLAWGASTVETLRGGPQVWFDAAVMFVFLLLAARVLEQRARSVATLRLDTLARARPVLAVREKADGQLESVPVAQLVPDDVLRVAAGEHLPADGILLDEVAGFDESLLTGEFRPVARHAGEDLLAGSICPDQTVRLRVTASGAATRLSAMERLVHSAQAHRPRVAELADRIASWFVLGMALLAAAVYLYWRHTEPARALEVMLALLVISCPCALSLAVPAALASAYSRLSQLGILVLHPNALQELAAIDTVAFDKTGTLGMPHTGISATQVFGGTTPAEAQRLAAALERDSRHPLAASFRQWDDGRPTTAMRLMPGAGIEALIAATPLRIGTAAFAAGREDDGAIWLGDGTQPLARFVIGEEPRAETASALATLSAMGLKLQILSGDAQAAVVRFADQIGVQLEQASGRLLPEEKLRHIRDLQATGRHVAMVGDGINDAPVLAGADVSIAVADGAALARQSADIVLLHPSIERVGVAIRIAHRTRGIIRQNLAWALAYNLAALPIAALGFVPPWAAAVAMVASSLTVTLNALRLSRVQVP